MMSPNMELASIQRIALQSYCDQGWYHIEIGKWAHHFRGCSA